MAIASDGANSTTNYLRRGVGGRVRVCTYIYILCRSLSARVFRKYAVLSRRRPRRLWGFEYYFFFFLSTPCCCFSPPRPPWTRFSRSFRLAVSAVHDARTVYYRNTFYIVPPLPMTCCSSSSIGQVQWKPRILSMIIDVNTYYLLSLNRNVVIILQLRILNNYFVNPMLYLFVIVSTLMSWLSIILWY